MLFTFHQPIFPGSEISHGRFPRQILFIPGRALAYGSQLRDDTDSERHECREVRQEVEVQAGELTLGVEGQHVEAETG
jgi:hypothetical protein